MFDKVEKFYSKNLDGTSIFNSYIITIRDIIKYVPLDPANSDYQAIQEWIAEGNTVIDNGGNS